MYGMKYTQVTSTVFQHIQLGAGIVVSDFDPTDGSVTTSDILGETSGGVSFKEEIEFSDFGEDIDNIPPNTKDLKRIETRSATMSGTFISLTEALATKLLVAADDSSGAITPRMTLTSADFFDVWWVGDYSNVNNDSGTGTGAAKAGFVAIHLMNSLNTNGFEIQSSNDGKGTFPFEFTGHYTLADPDTVPYKVYISVGTPAA